MNNRTEGSRQPAQPEQTTTNGSGETAGTQPCPVGTPWCRRHANDTDNDGWCVTRPIMVAGAQLEISNGTFDAEPALYGLYELPDNNGLTPAVAREVVDAITALLEEVGR